MDLFLSASQGYTHYEAKDLNRVMVLLETTTQMQGGFNNYQVDPFNGHPQNALVIGAEFGKFRLGLEAEFWVESFAQLDVAFDTGNIDRNHRINCDSLRSPSYVIGGEAGCLDAKEVFTFLPITLQASYYLALGRHFNLAAGYGLGFMAGSAHISMATEYFGAHAAQNDKVEFSIYPGVNPLHKFFLDMEVLPADWVGLQMRAGWRISQLKDFTLTDKKGDSKVFNLIFPKARNGAKLHIQSFSDKSDEDVLFLGTPEDAANELRHTKSLLHTVQGDFTGWFLALKLNLYWRDL